jgi:hypothetical protein
MRTPVLIATTLCGTTLLVQCALAPGVSAPTPRDLTLPDRGVTESGRKPPPLRDVAPLALTSEERKIRDEVDAEICGTYRRWRAQGNHRSDHMEGWCPTGRDERPK